MEKRSDFRQRVDAVLNTIDPDILAYNEDEFWMIRSAYEYVDFYATRRRLYNTKIALPLVRGMHNGSYRKSCLIKDGVKYKVPYMIHPLQVCRLIIDLQINITPEEEDILIASSLCHDMIEDIPFEDGGRELVTDFHLDEAVYETVKAVTKRRDFTDVEERAFFANIETHKLAMLLKLSDRGNNVEDLYNMSLWKIHEYADETRKFFLPMCKRSMIRYPEIEKSLLIMENKMITLITAAETMADHFHEQEMQLEEKLILLREENEQLRKDWQSLWDR